MGNAPSNERELLKSISRLPRQAEKLSEATEETWKPLLQELCSTFHPFVDPEHAAFVQNASMYHRMQDGGALEGVSTVLTFLTRNPAPDVDLRLGFDAYFRLLCAPHLAPLAAKDTKLFDALRAALSLRRDPAVAALQVLHKLMVGAHLPDAGAVLDIRLQCLRRGALDMLEEAMSFELSEDEVHRGQRVLLAMDAVCEVFVWDRRSTPLDMADTFFSRLLRKPDTMLRLSRHPQALLRGRAALLLEACLLRGRINEIAALRDAARLCGALLWQIRRAVDLICDNQGDADAAEEEPAGLVQNLMVPIAFAPKAALRRIHRDVTCLLCLGHTENSAALCRLLPERLLRWRDAPVTGAPRAIRLPHHQAGFAGELAVLGVKEAGEVAPSAGRGPSDGRYRETLGWDSEPSSKRFSLKRFAFGDAQEGAPYESTLHGENWIALLEALATDDVGVTMKWDAEARKELRDALRREEDMLDGQAGKLWDGMSLSVRYSADHQFLRVGKVYVDALVQALGHQMYNSADDGDLESPVRDLLRKPIDSLWRLYERIVIDEKVWHRLSCMRAMRLIIAAQKERLSCVPVILFVEILCEFLMYKESEREQAPADGALTWLQLIQLDADADVRAVFRTPLREEPSRFQVCREIVLILDTILFGDGQQPSSTYERAVDFINMKGIELLMLFYTWPYGSDFRAVPEEHATEVTGWRAYEEKSLSVAALCIRLTSRLVSQCPSAIELLARPRYLRRLVASLGLLGGLGAADGTDCHDREGVEELLHLLEAVLKEVPHAISGLYCTGFFHYVCAASIKPDGKGCMMKIAARLLSSLHLRHAEHTGGAYGTNIPFGARYFTEHKDGIDTGHRLRRKSGDGARTSLTERLDLAWSKQKPEESSRRDSAFAKGGLAGALGFGKGINQAQRSSEETALPQFSIQQLEEAPSVEDEDNATGEDSRQSGGEAQAAPKTTPWHLANESYLQCLWPQGLIAALIALAPDEFCRVFNAPAVDTPDIYWHTGMRSSLRDSIAKVVVRNLRTQRPMLDSILSSDDEPDFDESLLSLTGVRFMPNIGSCTKDSEDNLPRLATFPPPALVGREGLSLGPKQKMARFQSLFLRAFLHARKDDDFIVAPYPSILKEVLAFIEQSDAGFDRSNGREEDLSQMENVESTHQLRIALSVAQRLYLFWPATRSYWSASAAKVISETMRKSLSQDRSALPTASAALALLVTVLRCPEGGAEGGAEGEAEAEAEAEVEAEADGRGAGGDTAMRAIGVLDSVFFVLEVASVRLETMAKSLDESREREVWLNRSQVASLSAAILGLEWMTSQFSTLPEAVQMEWLTFLEERVHRFLRIVQRLLVPQFLRKCPPLVGSVLELLNALATLQAARLFLVHLGIPLMLLSRLLNLVNEEPDMTQGLASAKQDVSHSSLAAKTRRLARAWALESTSEVLEDATLPPLDGSDSASNLLSEEEDEDEEEEVDYDDEEAGEEGDADSRSRAPSAAVASALASLRPAKDTEEDAADHAMPVARGPPTIGQWQMELTSVPSANLTLSIAGALRNLLGSGHAVQQQEHLDGRSPELLVKDGFRQLLTPGLVYVLRNQGPSAFVQILGSTIGTKTARVMWYPPMRGKLTKVVAEELRKVEARLQEKRKPLWELSSFVSVDGCKYLYTMIAEEVVVDDIFIEVLARKDEGSWESWLQDCLEGTNADVRQRDQARRNVCSLR